MPKVLITGITGFIGSYLAEKLLSEGCEVYGLIRRVASRNIKAIEKISKDIVLFNGDIANYASIRSALKVAKPDSIVHLAGLTPVRDSFERPFEYEEINVLGTMNIAHAILELPDPQTRRLIAASTAEVYGLQETKPLIEELPLKPTSPYAVSKAAADIYLQMMSQTYGLNATILRPTNTYGRRLDTSFIIEYLVTYMLKREKVYVGAPDSVRDYMYIDDHVNAYLLALKKEEANGQVFNVGTGVGTSNRELAEKIANKIGYNKTNITFGSYPPGYAFRPLISDQPYIVLDATKIKTKLEWKTTVSLDDGLDKIISYFQSNPVLL